MKLFHACKLFVVVCAAAGVLSACNLEDHKTPKEERHEHTEIHKVEKTSKPGEIRHNRTINDTTRQQQ